MVGAVLGGKVVVGSVVGGGGGSSVVDTGGGGSGVMTGSGSKVRTGGRVGVGTVVVGAGDFGPWGVPCDVGIRDGMTGGASVVGALTVDVGAGMRTSGGAAGRVGAMVAAGAGSAAGYCTSAAPAPVAAAATESAAVVRTICAVEARRNCSTNDIRASGVTTGSSRVLDGPSRSVLIKTSPVEWVSGGVDTP